MDSEVVVTETKEKEDRKESGNVIGRFWSRNWSWIISTAVAAVFMLVIMKILKVAPFGTYGFTLVDSIHQYVPFFSDYQDKLKTGGNLFYTWDVGMGQNFQSLLLYYMASPLNLIIAFVSRRHIMTVMSCLISLKMAISAGTFSFFLSRRKGKCTNNMMIVALGLAYGLNNYMCGYMWNLMWLDSIMVLPLIILGYERLIKKKDPRLYTLALFYSLYCNYYISFIICIFLVLWFLTTGHTDVRKFFFDGLRFAGASILAAMMSGLTLLISYLGIMKTASAGADIPQWSWYQNFFELIKNQFFLTKPINMNTFDGPANLYCGTLCIVMLFIYVFSNKINIWEKLGKIVLIAIFLVSMNQELLNFIWHGFHNQYGIPNRFSFLYIFTLLVICYDMTVRLRKTHMAAVILGVVLSLAFLFTCYFTVGFSDIKSVNYFLAASVFLMVIYGALLILRRINFISVKINTIFLGLLLILEIITNAAVGLTSRTPASGEFYLQYTEEMEESTAKIKEQADSKDLKFYREEIIDPILLDENTYNNMKSVGTFCSTVRGDMVTVMNYMGFYTGANEFIYMGATPVTNDLFGVRYIYVRNDKYFPESDDLVPVLTTDDMVVYENTSAMLIAYGVNSEVLTLWGYKNYDVATVLNSFAQCATNETYNIFEPVYPIFGVTGSECDATFSSENPTTINFSNANSDDMYVNASFEVKEDGRYYINIRANYINEITYSLNGEEKTADRYQTQMLDLGDLKEGDVVHFKIAFSSSHSTDGTITVYTAKLDPNALTTFRANLIKRQMNVSEVRDGYVKGDILLDDNQIIFTSIPYDEGWTVYLDGKKVEPVKVGDAFLGIKAGEGQHTVEMKYVSEGFYPGLILSIIGWLVFATLCIYISLKKRTKKSIIK